MKLKELLGINLEMYCFIMSKHARSSVHRG